MQNLQYEYNRYHHSCIVYSLLRYGDIELSHFGITELWRVCVDPPQG